MNILVVRTDKLGDFITALPSMYVLKHYNANNKIIALVAPLNKALTQNCDFIDEVIVDDGKSSVFELSRKIKELHIDTSVTLFSNTRVALAQFLARIPSRYAPATKIAQIFYNHRVKQRRSEVKMAEFEYNLALAREVFPDIILEYPKPLLRFNDAKELYVKFSQEHGITKEVVAFHVGFGGSSDANWNLDEYEELIRAMLTQKKYQIVLTFGPDEIALKEDMSERLKNEDVIFYPSNDGIVNFAKLISNFKLFVSTSTGTYHLASLVGTATLTFFGDSNFASSKRWKSIGDEKLQKHYMLPQDEAKRKEMFEEVKKELCNL
ncbi:glycosyltransferase family 9 protein [Sulfurimonas paralvinellae]|uniref:Glycosyltransferase family 9 protein n=1 Tax=Sulfurimonas paralvinellae TaxID=317658 RepID=A0A7M1BBD2_9BACT|nr:glycosyltransferase family 9 protein [Sulfurimonas paralvinellae]QOP46128.1 glycosyltransferase family 9 protein [Sulfurimonas paralvinellae]